MLHEAGAAVMTEVSLTQNTSHLFHRLKGKRQENAESPFSHFVGKDSAE